MATILIVEDEAAINELLCRNLRMVGQACFSALDGKEALEMLEGRPL